MPIDRRACFTCLLLALAACAAEPASRVTVADSAGVRVTVSPDTSATFAVLDTVPSVSLGGADAEGATRFFRIQNIFVDEASRIWVADGQTNQLRIFDGRGVHWKTRGGRGEGPGEFLQIRLLGAIRGDSVVAGDSRTDRITVFDPRGELARTRRLPGTEHPAPRPFDTFRRGAILGQLPRTVAAASLEPGQILRDSVELVRVSLDSTLVEPYGTAAGPVWIWTGRSQVPLPFTVNASFDVVGSAVHLVSGTHFRVRVFEGARLRESYGVERDPRAVGAADLDGYRAFVADYVPEPMRPDYLAALESEFRPSLLPAYDRVLAASDGHVWAQIYEADLASPHDWDVFDEHREFVGRVHVPAGFYPMVITTDDVVGVWRDSTGVEFVRAYPLRRF